MACVLNEVSLGYFNVPSSFDIIKRDCSQCKCLSWMMLHLTFNNTIERGSKLVQAQHFNGFSFKLWQHLLALNNMLVLFLLHYSSPVGSCVFENKREKNWRCKKPKKIFSKTLVKCTIFVWKAAWVILYNEFYLWWGIFTLVIWYGVKFLIHICYAAEDDILVLYYYFLLLF